MSSFLLGMCSGGLFFHALILFPISHSPLDAFLAVVYALGMAVNAATIRIEKRR